MDVKKLQDMANKLRIHSINSTTSAGSGHPTSCMSCAEIMSSLFFSELNKNDEFILNSYGISESIQKTFVRNLINIGHLPK